MQTIEGVFFFLLTFHASFSLSLAQFGRQTIKDIDGKNCVLQRKGGGEVSQEIGGERENYELV